jgi:hypothetical protein
VRDALASSVMTWHAAMKRALVVAREEGHLRADVDEEQMLFEIHGLILALHYEARFLKNPGSMSAPRRLRQHPAAVRRRPKHNGRRRSTRSTKSVKE